MPGTQFEVVSLNKGSFAINDRGRTVALVSRFGDIDWLLKTSLEEGILVESVRKETHLCYTLGLKIELYTNAPATAVQTFTCRVDDRTGDLIIRSRGLSPDGNFTSETLAVLHTDDAGIRYEWDLETTLVNISSETIELSGIEYNNVYPSKAYLGTTSLDRKMYTATIMTDENGVAWNFPHQHSMHYGVKSSSVKFGHQSMAGFFGDPGGSPVVEVMESSLPLDWGICDMFYDLHCGARPDHSIQPGETLRFQYVVKYLNSTESAAIVDVSQPVPVDDEDRRAYDYPRLDLGLNQFNRAVNVDRPDEALCFRTRPPVRVWDREIGHTSAGSLRITHETPQQTIWRAEPPSRIPAEVVLKINAMIKTREVTGKGAYIRVGYHTWEFEPVPHVESAADLDSAPVTGTTGWVKVRVPELKVPASQFDYLVYLDVILDGAGTAWITDLDISLEAVPDSHPSWEEGSVQKALKKAASKPTVGSGATV